MDITNTAVWGFEHAIRGARNPLESWDRSDSFWSYKCNKYFKVGSYTVGESDSKLMQ